MDVRVRLFATLRDTTGTEECWLALESGARGVDAKTTLVARHPRLAGLIEYARLAINQEYQAWETPLHDGDELALIPPVSGG
jgi:molybdopterin converting factor subunit 1